MNVRINYLVILLFMFFFSRIAVLAGDADIESQKHEEPQSGIYPQELFLIAARGADGQVSVDLLRNAARRGSLAVPQLSPVHDAIAETGEYTLNYPTPGMEGLVRYLLQTREPDLAKLEELGLVLADADTVAAPRIEGAVRTYENKVSEILEFGHATLFVGRTLKVHETDEDSRERIFLSSRNLEKEFITTSAHRHYPIRIALIVSGDIEGDHNAMVVGLCLIISEDPFTVAIWIGKTRHSYGFIEENMEFVYAVPAYDMKREVIVCGTKSGRDIDKFKYLDPATLSPSAVRAPVLKEAVANFECEVIETLDAGSHTIFIGRERAQHLTAPGKPPLFYFGGPQEVEDNYSPLPQPGRVEGGESSE